MRLNDLQHWFAKKITSASQLEDDAACYLAPQDSLEIYRQQYWRRLTHALCSHFPSLVSLLGRLDFEQSIALPYLTCYPPKNWSLCRLGEELPNWLFQHYQAKDADLVTQMAHLDWAAQEAFWIESLPPLEHVDSETLFLLQPHVHLFDQELDLFGFREALLKGAPATRFPVNNYGKKYFVLYRSEANMVTWKEVSFAQHWVLSRFKHRNSLDNVCAELETLGGELLECALIEFPFWFKQWTVLKWFRL